MPLQVSWPHGSFVLQRLWGFVLVLTLDFVPLEVRHGLHDGLDEGERVAAGDAHRRAHPAHRPAQVVVPVAPARPILEGCGRGGHIERGRTTEGRHLAKSRVRDCYVCSNDAAI